MNRLDVVEKSELRDGIPDFQPGDTVRVHVRIKESENKERLQAFEGIVIARKHGGARETITVRKTSFGVGAVASPPLRRWQRVSLLSSCSGLPECSGNYTASI